MCQICFDAFVLLGIVLLPGQVFLCELTRQHHMKTKVDFSFSDLWHDLQHDALLCHQEVQGLCLSEWAPDPNRLSNLPLL